MSLDVDPVLTALAATAALKGRTKRTPRLRLEVFDWDCQRHILLRFAAAEIAAAIQPFRMRPEPLQDEHGELRAALAN